MPRPKLNQLEMLVAVADAGSFGGAAVELGCTQSRISHAITELEGILATRLLVRSRTGSVPTEAGHGVLAKARRILRLADSLVDGAEEPHAVIGRVSIACFRSVGAHLLPRALEALATDYPGLRIDVDDNCEERLDVTRAIEEGRSDIGVAQLPAGDGFVTRPYVSDDYVLVAPASLPVRAPVSWAQFDRVPYIQLDCSGAFAILARCREAGFQAEPSRTLATDTGILAMVQRGLGYSILPRLVVFPVPDGIRVFDLPIPARRQFALVTLPENARLKAVQVVLRVLNDKRFVKQAEAFRAGIVHW
jgi:DNA-binding transcriptional LysR family regulator